MRQHWKSGMFLAHPTTLRGAANQLLVLLLGAVIALSVLGGMLAWLGRSQKQSTPALVMYCAAGMRVPVTALADRYEKECGTRVELQFGGSNTLLSQLEVNRSVPVDLYLAADDFYTTLARQKGLVAETIPVAKMRPVIVTGKANPKHINALEDLLRPDVRLALGNPDQAAIGRTVRAVLTDAERDGQLWKRFEEHVMANGVFKPTVNEVANDVKIGSVDAGIVWDATAAMPTFRDSLAVVASPVFDAAAEQVTVGVVTTTRSPVAALQFARYLTARDRGLPVFAEYGFAPVEGDVWAVHPEITFFCGAVNRRAVDDVIKAFAKREGVTINTVYNGCGILTGQMRTLRNDHGGAGFPDMYMACDRYYLETVADWFQEDVDVSDADIVLAVPKGNPKKITSLADLTKPGMRVAVGQPQQCTIGVLTRTLLEKEGVYDAVMKNVVTQTGSSAMLVPTVVTKSVDAAIAYITDTKAESDKVDTVRLDSPYAKAVQPFSIARSSDHKQLTRRFFQALADAREKFESAGFHFRLTRSGADGKESQGR